MAAYAALVSLMHIIYDIKRHHSPPISLDKQQVESLTEIVTFLQEFLDGYNSPVADGDEADPLEMRIADAAYAVEDVIESHIVDKIQLSRSKETKTSGFFNCFRAPKNPKNVHSSLDGNRNDEQIDLYQDLQKVIEEMDLIKRVAMETNTEKVAVHDQLQRIIPASVASLRSSSSTGKNSSLVVCPDDVLNGIMEKLVAGRLHRQVIPIVGMGGIGKTTLARTVYSKPLIKEHFVICAWATISQQYDTREILCEILSQATNKKKEELSERSEDKLGTELYQYLYGRRFLVVMDDMWSVDAWDKIQRFFPNNDTGSRVLVTTRQGQLSSQLNNNYSLQMEFLDEGSSWDLFSKIVFGEDDCPRQLEEIGKKIVENCRGLPLSIVVVGGILKNMKHVKQYWESIRKKLASVVNLENDKHCLRLLKMSYSHLPVYLKPCFLYMGVFEEDDSISVSTLVKLWVSEGFLKPIDGKSLRTMAKGFLKDLVDRNLILIDELGSTGNIKSVKVHDLLRDLCLNEARKDGFYHVIGQSSPRGVSSQRRVVIRRNTSKKRVLNDLKCMSHARSVICEYGKVPRCRNFGLLRTLHAYKFRTFEDKSYVNSLVFQYVNLRHLAVEVGSMSSIFTSLNLLWNLQTLIVSCYHKSTAPTEIWRMPQLRHIELSERRLRLPEPSSDATILENLEVLEGVHNFKCSEEVVKRIPNVKKLGIKYSGDEGVDRGDHYCLSNIKCLSKLESFYVSCEYDFRGNDALYKLTFPHSLKSLTLVMKGNFEWEEMMEKIGSLPLLEKFKLWVGCFGTGKWEMVEDQFPCLKYLGLFSCHSLKQWTVEASSIFPRLEKLDLSYLGGLEEIPSEIGNIPTLQKFRLFECNESAMMSAKKIVDEQVELQGDQLPFHVLVYLGTENQAVKSLADRNFEVLG